MQVFLYRRPLLSVSTHAYISLSKFSAEDGFEYELPVAVRDELLACTFLA